MGSNPKLAATVQIILLLGLYSMKMVKSAPHTEIKTVLCNGAAYTAGDPFAISLSYVVDELEKVTATRKNYEFSNISPYPNAFAYGHASCNQNLTTSDCTACLGAAKTIVLGSCRNRIGARAVLRDCSVRYEQYPFSD